MGMDDFEDLIESMLQPNSKMHQRSRKYSLREISPDDLFERSEETRIDQNGFPQKIEHAVIHWTDCGHIAHNDKELNGRCSCGNTLCFDCSKDLSCKRCFRTPLCTSCARLLGDEVYCLRCRNIILLERVGIFSLKGIHSILSKEIS